MKNIVIRICGILSFLTIFSHQALGQSTVTASSISLKTLDDICGPTIRDQTCLEMVFNEINGIYEDNLLDPYFHLAMQAYSTLDSSVAQTILPNIEFAVQEAQNITPVIQSYKNFLNQFDRIDQIIPACVHITGMGSTQRCLWYFDKIEGMLNGGLNLQNILTKSKERLESISGHKFICQVSCGFKDDKIASSRFQFYRLVTTATNRLNAINHIQTYCSLTQLHDLADSTRLESIGSLKPVIASGYTQDPNNNTVAFTPYNPLTSCVSIE